MSKHEKFGVMSVMAATGQLDTTEWEEWNRHVESCRKCRNLTRDFVQIGAQALLPRGDKYKRVKVDGEMTARFVERARKEGVVLQSPAQPFKNAFKYRLSGWGLAPVALLIPAILAGISAFDHWRQNIDHDPTLSRRQWIVPQPVPGSILQAKSTRIQGTQTVKRTGSSPVLRQLKSSRLAIERSLMSSWRFPGSVSLDPSPYHVTFNRTSPFMQNGSWPSVFPGKPPTPSQRMPMMMAVASFSPVLPLRWESQGTNRSGWDPSKGAVVSDYPKLQAVNDRHIDWRQVQQDASQPRFADGVVWPESAVTRERP